MSVLPPSADSLLPRFLGKPARLCPACGGRRYRLNPAGAILCVVCKPADPSYPELVAELAGRPPRLAWSVPSEDFDSDIVQSPADAAGSIGEPSGGVGRGAGAAGVAGWGDPESRPDPDNGPSELLIVSTRLEFERAPVGGFWESEAAEVVCLPSPGVPEAPAGIWRRISQPYFAWLVGCLKQMNFSGNCDQRNHDVLRALQEIAVEAYQVGEFGEWALDGLRWPWAPPAGFVPPVMPKQSQVWDWGRGVSGSQLDRLIGFEPAMKTGGKESKNGGSSGKDDCRGNRSHGGGVRGGVAAGIRRDGLFGDECPD